MLIFRAWAFFFFPRISGNFQESRHKWPQAFSDPKWNSWDLPCSLELALWWVTWVASDSALVRRESREGSKNKNNGGWGGEGGVRGWRRKHFPAANPTIKPGTFCLRASQIWSYLICGRRLKMLWIGFYLNRVCAKVYQIWALQSIVGDRAGQFFGNDGVRIWLEKIDCLLEIAST